MIKSYSLLWNSKPEPGRREGKSGAQILVICSWGNQLTITFAVASRPPQQRREKNRMLHNQAKRASRNAVPCELKFKHERNLQGICNHQYFYSFPRRTKDKNYAKCHPIGFPLPSSGRFQNEIPPLWKKNNPPMRSNRCQCDDKHLKYRI